MWFNTLRNTRRPIAAVSPRLRLEALEGRCLLSAGQLDPTFGSGGVVTTPISSGDMALQPDGKVLAGGGPFQMTRYTPAGTLDTTFGNGGNVTTTIAGWSLQHASAMALYPATGTANDGKIVMTGNTSVSTGKKTSETQLALVRYNANGSLDTTFGTGGAVTNGFGNATYDLGEAVVVQPDGKILVAGRSGGYANPTPIVLARYNANGTPDLSFGSGGSVISLPGGTTVCDARAVALQPDGRIVVGGFLYLGGDNLFAVVRYTANGTLDTTFGQGGFAAVSVFAGGATSFGAFDVAVQPDGRVVAAGRGRTTFPGTPSALTLVLARFTAAGSLDTSFAGTGIVSQNPLGPGAYDSANGVALQPDGKIVGGGLHAVIATNQQSFMLLRYNPDGGLDTTFNGTGIVLTSSFKNTIDGSGTVAIQPADGKIVVRGTTVSGSFVVLARYLGDPPPQAASVAPLAAKQVQPILQEASVRYTPDGSLGSSLTAGGSRSVTGLSGGYGNDIAIRQADGTVNPGEARPGAVALGSPEGTSSFLDDLFAARLDLSWAAIAQFLEEKDRS
ncbi:MAG: delta-60 repeat domain-containing protein [Gemmataceae bacterium]